MVVVRKILVFEVLEVITGATREEKPTQYNITSLAQGFEDLISAGSASTCACQAVQRLAKNSSTAQTATGKLV